MLVGNRCGRGSTGFYRLYQGLKRTAPLPVIGNGEGYSGVTITRKSSSFCARSFHSMNALNYACWANYTPACQPKKKGRSRPQNIRRVRMFARKMIQSSAIATGLLLAALAGTAHADPAANKELVIEAVTALFINQDPDAPKTYWAEDYIQHNPMFPNGREVIEGMVGNLPPNFSYQMGAVFAEDDLVILRGRYTGFGPKPMVGADMYRVKDGKIVEHWDILQEEVPTSDSANGNPMFEPGL